MILDYEGLKAILNQLPLGVILANEKGDALLGNDRACDLLGVDPLDLMQSGLAALTSIVGLDEAVNALRDAEGRKEQVDVKLGRKCLSITLTKAGLSLFGEACVLILVSDDTEQHKLEEIRTAFSGEILRRIRGPLTSVKTSLAFLSSGTASDLSGPFREIASLGHLEVQRLHALVNQMGELLSLEGAPGESDLYLETINLEDLLERCLRRIRKSPSAQGREIRVEMAPGPRPLQVVADYEKLASVLGHVLANALAYSSPASPVRVYLGERKAFGQIRIEDQGPGIRPEDLPHVFEKFFRSSDPAVAKLEGSGLGLFIARANVELMEGSIHLESAFGRGTSVSICLPLAQAGAWPD